MIVAKFAKTSYVMATGLTQWDYGQELAVECSKYEIPDGTEVHFYQKKLSHMGYMSNNHVMIPDLMLQSSHEIVAYVYVRGVADGETILTIKLPITPRQQPIDYVLPEYTEYSRLLPAGGTDGQHLMKQSDADFDVAWETVEVMDDEEIDSLFGETTTSEEEK